MVAPVSIPAIDPTQISFNKAPVLRYSSRGTPYTRWVSFGMPQLGQYSYLLDVPVFLYRNADDARAGVDSGGTGFFVSVQSKTRRDKCYVYVVTNWHVVCPNGCSTIRVNCKNGEPDIFEHDPAEWFFLPKFHDIAVIPIRLDGNKHQAAALNGETYIVTPDYVEAEKIGPGDDVFMIGRFIDYDGVEVNRPAMRFGNISIIDAPVKQLTGYSGQSIVVDMHSRTGHSGSPVFVYRTAGSLFAEKGQWVTGHTMKLLGIHWGQFPELWELKEGVKEPESEAALITEGKYVKGLSGMTCVCPAWAILEVLNMPRLREIRERNDRQLEKQPGALPAEGEVTISNGELPTKDENPRHREDFSRLLDAAAKGPKPSPGKA